MTKLEFNQEEKNGTTNVSIFRQESLFGVAFDIYGDMDNPLFLAKDVAIWIGYDTSSLNKLVNSVDEDEKVRNIVPTLGGNQEMWLLTENGLYEVLMQSRKPIAKQFKKGVKEILKSIRKHGAYLTPQKIEEVLLSPDTLIKLATNLKEEQTKRIEAERQIESHKQTIEIQEKNILVAKKEISTLKPKAEFLDKAVLTSETTVDIGQTAKILKLSYGRNTLFRKLRDLGIFFKHRNEPKQEYINRGLFEVFEVPYEKNGRMLLNLKVLVTQDGLYWLDKKLCGSVNSKQIAQFS